MQTISIDSFRLKPVLTMAQEKAGIIDSTDEEIIEPLTILLASYRSEAGFSDMGLQITFAHLIDNLVMRMRIREAIRRHPAILKEEVDDPVIILGLPRTGTTKLQRTLSATGVFQILPLWKILNPLPLTSDKSGTDSRLIVAEQFVAGIKQAIPRFYAGHPMVATEPDEEALLQELCFRAESFSFSAHIPSYDSLVLNQNTEPSYRWLKMVLQLMQWQDESAPNKRRWLLKSPMHIGRLDEIFAAFPNATIIHCHRDLLSAIPSGAALTEAMRTLYTGKADKSTAGRYALESFSKMTNANVEARERWEAAGKKFIDVRFSDIVDCIGGITDDIFKRTALPFNTEARKVLAQWEAANPQHKHGNFDYDLESYSLSAAEIENRFAAYSTRYLSGTDN